MKTENTLLSLAGCDQANDLWEGVFFWLLNEKAEEEGLAGHLFQTSQLPSDSMSINHRVRALSA